MSILCLTMTLPISARLDDSPCEIAPVLTNGVTDQGRPNIPLGKKFVVAKEGS